MADEAETVAEKLSTPIVVPAATDRPPAKDDNAEDEVENTLTEKQLRAIPVIIDTIYRHRLPDGHDPSKVFHRKVNKRALPGYYDVIKEPIALSTLRAKSHSKEYKTFSAFVRDCALLAHNAQTYNRPEAQAYQDALTIKALVESQFHKLAKDGVIEPEVAILPDLGEIPEADPAPEEEPEEEEDDEDEDDEEDEEGEDSDDDEPKKKRGRGRPSSSTKRQGMAEKVESGKKESEISSKKRRGRPPRVDTPMEARIKAVLKGVRKPKNDLGQIIIYHFERLPDKIAMPEYYLEIKDPIAIEIIKRKQKRKKYTAIKQFQDDMDKMFENAKSYNEDDSQIYKDAVTLQKEAQKLIDEEIQKPDSDFAMEEGRIPLPNGINHNGEHWKVGDWTHIQNANDVTKPIVAQIYRTFQDTDGQRWVNACWFYRPEQTVHQFEKHFYANEVVKTGQYEDHRVEDIIDRCFVMFFTRYSRGRPRGFPADKEVYVCEARYNEEKHSFNKIKTWNSCLPDEVKDKDYEMVLFDNMRKEKKIPSPLLHLLKDDVTKDDVKVRWGAPKAPPLVGGVFKGEREKNQSPPPVPTPSPSPPPPPPPPLPRQVSTVSNHDSPSHRRQSDVNVTMEVASHAVPTAHGSQPTLDHRPNLPHQNISQYHRHSASPAPAQNHHYNQAPSSYAPQHSHATPIPPRHDQYATPQRSYTHQQVSSRPIPFSAPNLDGQRQPEVFMLDHAPNAAIPEDIRKQFQQNEDGRVLFFSTTPQERHQPIQPSAAVGHSVKYMAANMRRQLLEKKRRAEGKGAGSEDGRSKRVKPDEQGDIHQKSVKDMTDDALKALIKQMDNGTDQMWRSIYGNEWEAGKNMETQRLHERQATKAEQETELAESRRKRAEYERISMKRDTGPYLDDYDPRY